MKTLLLALLFVVVPAVASAQTDACQAAQPPFTLTSGAPFTITWLMDVQVPVSATDATLVPQRIDGYYLQINGGPKQDIVAVKGETCTVGAFANKAVYQYRMLTGVPKGQHTITVTPWNFVLSIDSNGWWAPTTTRQEGPAVAVPFAVVDPAQLGPPGKPLNVLIRR